MSKLDDFFARKKEQDRPSVGNAPRADFRPENRREYVEFKTRQYRSVFESIERTLLQIRRKLQSNGLHCEVLSLKLNDQELHVPVEHVFVLAGFARKSPTTNLPYVSASNFMKLPHLQIRVNVEKDSVYVLINDLKSEQVRRLTHPSEVTEEALEEFVLKILEGVL